jgi:hypothetical protein
MHSSLHDRASCVSFVLSSNDGAIITALGAPDVGAFLHAVPRDWGYGRMISGAFVLAIKIRLGIVAYDEADAGHVCPMCMKAPVDAQGRHSIMCLQCRWR